MDISRGEAVEHELNRLIEKRHDQRAASEEQRRIEDGWGSEHRKVQRRAPARVAGGVGDWTTDRLIFSVLIWPPLEADGRDARRVHYQRVEDGMYAVARGATDKAWSTYWEVDYGLVWNHERECWVDGDGHAYDGSRFGAGSRRPHAA